MTSERAAMWGGMRMLDQQSAHLESFSQSQAAAAIFFSFCGSSLSSPMIQYYKKTLLVVLLSLPANKLWLLSHIYFFLTSLYMTSTSISFAWPRLFTILITKLIYKLELSQIKSPRLFTLYLHPLFKSKFTGFLCIKCILQKI